MKALTISVLAAALAWSGFWGWSALSLRGAMTDWFEARRAEGWQAEYSEMRLRGFPNRVDIVFEDLRLTDPDRGLGYAADRMQILQLVYRPGHKILAWDGDQAVETRRGRYDIDSDGLRASVVFDSEGRLLRTGLEAELLNVDGPNRATALAGLKGGLHLTDPSAHVYRLGLSADAAAGSGSGALDGLDLQADIAFDSLFRRDGLGRDRPQPRRIDLRLAEYRQADVYFKAAGSLDIDNAGQPDGRLTLRAENWRALLDRAIEAGQLPAALGSALRDGLGLIAGLSGDPDRLELPLDFGGGAVRLGPVPLGAAPTLQLP